ncbi:MAG: hypothetical protein ACE5FG_00720 [Myxococcota bacterium]
MAYYARNDFFNDPRLLDRVVEILRGKLTLDWMQLEIERVRCRPSHPDRGLSYEDTNVGSYGWDRIPEKIRHNYSMAPRGAVQPPGLPHLGYDINCKSEVWSENAPRLYEEAKARHWIPTRMVPWHELESLAHSEDMERGLAQLYTDLTAMATALCDVPSKWVWHINHELLELKSWYCAQMFDAAQLADVFRKRAIAGGTGLGRDQAALGELLKCVMDSGTYPCVSVSAHLLLCGLMQILLRHVGAVSRNAADQTIVSFGVQDLSRTLSYGMGHVRYLLEARPHEAVGLGAHLDEVENAALGLLGAPLFFSALALVTAGERKRAPDAVPRIAALYGRFVEEHQGRRRAVGLGGGASPLARWVHALES